MPVTSTPKVVIVILNWNGKDDTLKCLESVFKIDYPNFEVVVVDNGSSDGSVPAIRQAFPQAQLIETGKNLGYAGGNNVGIRYALDRGAEFVFVLNNDTKVARDTLAHLVAEANRHPEAAVLGPVICYMDRPDVIWTAGDKFVDPIRFFQQSKTGESIASLKDQSDSYETDRIMGAALFMRDQILSEIGLFDERYFLTNEESDWCWRARRVGHTCRIVPKSIIWHKVGGALGSGSSPLRLYFNTRNRLLFAEKNLSKKAWLKTMAYSLRWFFPPLSFSSVKAPFLKHLYWSIRGAVKLWQDPRQKARRRGVLDYLLRRFGDCPPQIRALNVEWNTKRQAISTTFSIPGEQTDV